MSRIRQLLPPAPAFTEKNLLDLSGKVYIVTGSNSGIGFLLCKLLYAKNATVYIAARSAARAGSLIHHRPVASSSYPSTSPTLPL
jgi:retinol dehydrogenase 12